MRIDKRAFLGRRDLSEYEADSNVTEIGDWAFAKCVNLKKVILPKGVVLGKGVFEGCTSLTNVFCGSDECDDLSFLLAALATSLPAQYLMRDDDVGSDDWYSRWDLAMLAFLRQDDLEGYSNRALCGEEDISTDGILSVDGELMGESEEYVANVAKNKCRLCYIRLLHKVMLTEDTCSELEDYIRAHAFGVSNGAAWAVLLQDTEEKIEYYKLYMDVVNPTADELDLMIADMGSAKAQAKSFLLSERAKMRKDAFSDFIL